MRTIAGSLTLPAPPERKTNDAVEKTFTIRTVTPVIGAGVEGGRCDVATPVRGGTIRGLLRQWWRTFYNARTIERVQEKEEEIWGWAEKPGKVDIHVHDVEASPPLDNWTYYNSLAAIAGQRLTNSELDTARYVLFPLQKPREPREQLQKSGVIERLSFQLTVRCRDEETLKFVRAALRGWVQFGGIGARTRRGCGSLYCPDFSPGGVKQAQSWPKAQLFDVVEGWDAYRDPPVLPGQRIPRRAFGVVHDLL